jgi:hypothetical protein
MRKWIQWTLGVVLLVGTLGCGSDRDKGVNKDKDKPKPAATK